MELEYFLFLLTRPQKADREGKLVALEVTRFVLNERDRMLHWLVSLHAEMEFKSAFCVALFFSIVWFF